MKAKEFLKRYRDTEREINAKLEEISRLRALATKVTQTLTRGKKSPRQHEDRTAAIIAKIVDMEREVDAEIDRLQDIKREVQTVITAVPDAKLRELLVRRYICGQKWEKIAAEMHYSYYYVKNRLHFKAIKKMSTQGYLFL